MSKKILIFGNKWINENLLYKRKHPINMDDIDLNKTVLSDKVLMVKKTLLNTSLDAKVMVVSDH